MRIVVDNAHGQENWGQTGFPLRGIDSRLLDFASELSKSGFSCLTHTAPFEGASLRSVNGLVIPPPTGSFDPIKAQWEWSEETFFSGHEIDSILQFLRDGGSLLAFAYRFGDPFTKANLASLFAPLGCILNAEATINLGFLGEHPLHTTFTTGNQYIVQDWACEGVNAVQWRPATTFVLLSTYEVEPVVLLPNDCVRLGWPGYRTFYDSAPICVAGSYGKGRFILVGGPHGFECGEFGLINAADNRRFVANLMKWLFERRRDRRVHGGKVTSARARAVKNASPPKKAELGTLWEAVCKAETKKGKGESFLHFIAALLSDTNVLKLESKNIWSLDRESEIDLVFKCTSTRPLWAKCQGIVPVECKNWIQPVDAVEMSRFVDKLDRTSSKLGIFAARTFTSKAWSAVGKARTRRDIIVALLSDDDFEAYLSGQATAMNVVESGIVRSMLV